MDRREALEAAFDTHVEEEEVVDKVEKPDTTVDEPVKEVVVNEGDKDDVDPYKAEKKSAAADLERADKPDVGKAASKAKIGEEPAGDKPALENADDKAPLAWKPAERELYSKADPALRAIISRRELQVEQVMSRSAGARQFTTEFMQTVQPFAQAIREEGSTPLEAVKNLFTTAYMLRTGDAETKAKVAADILMNYKIDIPTLDKILSGQLPALSPAQLPPEVLRRIERGESAATRLEQVEKERERVLAETAQAEVEKLQGKPFFEDLRESMADIIEVKARRGNKISMEQAYELAVAADPEISKILGQRSRAADASAAATLARARKAGSTVNGAPASTGGGAVAATRREQLEAAWAERS